MSARRLLNKVYLMITENMDAEERTAFDYELNMPIETARAKRIQTIRGLGEIMGGG